MKEHPIIFSTDMVKAILDGRKSMTRRTRGLGKINKDPNAWFGIPEQVEGPLWRFFNNDSTTLIVKCPYGQVGDRLWVRETCWYPVDFDHSTVYYKADWGDDKPAEMLNHNGKWRPSIFMPKHYSRINLEITEVRVERVQEISREDIRAEGIRLPVSPRFTPGVLSELHQEFQELWDSLNAKQGYGWESNCFVWVISFKKEV